ncbi:MAG: hypothetical protein ABJO01_03280 [Parasphingorhabdus sp.]|uniref:hypothetical protein n=1 Tax=Parasphingorhabdus sp. TaxID=2709688 RepID=UPI0032971B15
MNHFVIAVMFFIACIWSNPAYAKWIEASSDHFIIYANKNEKTVRKFAERLELFHAALAYGRTNVLAKPSPSNRVTIFVVGSEGKVQKLARFGGRNIGGFYLPRAGATVAFVPELRKASNKFQNSPEQILFHEYAHHFMYGITDYSYPRWFSEGFAEFYSTVRFEKDGNVGLGLPAAHRAYELGRATDVPLIELLNTKKYLANKRKGYDNFYGKSWLLYHYLTFNPTRRKQFREYQLRLTNGSNEEEAAEVFGDIGQLAKDLGVYRRNRKWSYFSRPRAELKIGQITTRQLRSGEAKMMPVIMRSKRGVTREQAIELLPQAQEIAAGFPNDPAVQAALAEAEFDAGNNAAAIAAADRALVKDPRHINALIQKGYALAALAKDSEEPEIDWKAVRRQFVKANKVENDHPIPLLYYYRSYRDAGAEIPEIAVRGLERALEFAPFDSSLRWMVANQHAQDRRYDHAIQILRPLAFSPHRSKQSQLAEQLLEQFEEKRDADGQPQASN